MNILLLGSTGLIGSAVHAKLSATTHTVIAPTSAELDFQRPDTWAAWLQQADVLVNCVGVMSADSGLMQSVQCTAPQALYQQAQRAGMGYVLQVSALGASVDADTVFLRSKGQLDAWLLASCLNVGIVRPSLVFAKTGRSSRLFVNLAKLPHLWLPEAGHMVIQPLTIQPVALNDVATAVVAMLQSRYSGVVNAVGGEALSLAAYLTLLRQHAWQRGPAHIHALPVTWAKRAAEVLQHVSSGLITPASIEMLLESEEVEVEDFARILGRQPQTPAQFLQAAYAQGAHK